MGVKYKILVVDDQQFVVEALEHYLSEFGEIISALNGKDALGLFDNNQFDLVISDVNMRPMTGIELGHEIRKFNSETPIIFFSGEIDGKKIYKKEIEVIGHGRFIEKDFKHLKEAVKILIKEKV